MTDRATRRSGIPSFVPSVLERLPGRAGALAAGTAQRLREERFVGLVAEIGFFVIVGLAPLAIAAMALLGAFRPLLAAESATRVDGVFIGVIMQVFGGDVASAAFSDVQKLLNVGVSGLGLPLLVGVVFSARGFTGAMRGLAHLYGNEAQRPVWQDALATVGFTVAGALLATLGALGALLATIGDGTGAVLEVFSWLRWIIVPSGLLVLLTTLYRYSRGPDAEPWIREIPGALIATTGIMGAGLAFGVYLRSTPGLGLGPFLGAVVGVLLSVFTVVFVSVALVVIGGAFNAERTGD